MLVQRVGYFFRPTVVPTFSLFIIFEMLNFTTLEKSGGFTAHEFETAVFLDTTSTESQKLQCTLFSLMVNFGKGNHKMKNVWFDLIKGR